MSVATTRQSQPIAIQDFVAELRKLPATAFETTGQVLSFAREHPVLPASLEPFLFWDAQHYTRNLIDKTALYELIAICWEIGQGSSIHNHREQHCWMLVPIGRLVVQNYRVLFQDLAAGKCRLERSDLVEIDPANPVAVDPREPVHKVDNPGDFRQRGDIRRDDGGPAGHRLEGRQPEPLVERRKDEDARESVHDGERLLG